MTEEKIIEIAAKTALATWDKQMQKHKREQKNMRLWNTRMLLRHYTSLSEYCVSAVYSPKTAEDKESPPELLESINERDKNAYIDSIKGSVVRTKMIMLHVDRMLKIYKIYCDTSDKTEDARRYRVLHASYLAEKKLTMEQICKMENIDRSTYYRDKKESTAMLSALIFGADGISAMR